VNYKGVTKKGIPTKQGVDRLNTGREIEALPTASVFGTGFITTVRKSARSPGEKSPGLFCYRTEASLAHTAAKE
jgi:hypothetical protein